MEKLRQEIIWIFFPLFSLSVMNNFFKIRKYSRNWNLHLLSTAISGNMVVDECNDNNDNYNNDNNNIFVKTSTMKRKLCCVETLYVKLKL